MNRANVSLGFSFGVLVCAAMVLFQSQTFPPVGSGGSTGITVAGSAGTGTTTFDRTILGIDGTGANATYCFGDTNTCLYRGGLSAEDVSILTGGSTRWSFTQSALIPGSNNAYDLGSNLARMKDVYQVGRHEQTWADSSGTPGAATSNVRLFRASVATGASSVVITNSTATANDVCVANLRSSSATGCTEVKTCTAAAGTVTIVLDGTCGTAAAPVEAYLVRGS